MGLKIKAAGSKPKAASKTRSTSTKRSTSRTATRKSAPKRSTTKRTTKPAAAKSTPTSRGERRSAKTDMTQSQLKKFLGPLRTHADKRDKLREQWLAEVELAQTAMLEALDAGVPVGLVQEHANVSRQHIYKVLGERSTNGSGSKTRAKAAAKTKTTAKPKSSGTTNGRKKPGAKKASGRPKIRARR